MRVRCVYSVGDRYGKEATVASVITGTANTATGHKIHVQWDDGDTTFTTWTNFTSFEPVDSLTIVEQVAKQMKQGLANVIRQEKPCQVCSRPNDLGTVICWMCGNFPG